LIAAPGLLDHRGVGPDTAAALLIAAGDNPGRLGSEASFAALCGTSPVEASSGKTQRRRLNRGGRPPGQLRALPIVLSRLRWDPRTRDYMNRRIAQGKSRREAIRCLKRYVARDLYKHIIARSHNRPATFFPQPLDIHRAISRHHVTAKCAGTEQIEARVNQLLARAVFPSGASLASVP
jgi:hypothetical protein